MPEPKGVKEIDTKRIREQLGLDSMSMTIEQQVLAIIEENEAPNDKPQKLGLRSKTRMISVRLAAPD